VRNGSDAVYLESSALVKLAVAEDESAALQEALSAWPRRVSSRLAVVEVLRTVRRRDAGREPLAREVLRRLDLAVIGDGVLIGAAVLEPVGLRSLDAIHLATALRVRSSLAAFVSYDTRQLEAAEALGLPTASPR
jgi:predicted nucleic acid-binding protein